MVKLLHFKDWLWFIKHNEALLLFKLTFKSNQTFKVRNQVHTFKWNVSSYQVCSLLTWMTVGYTFRPVTFKVLTLLNKLLLWWDVSSYKVHCIQLWTFKVNSFKCFIAKWTNSSWANNVPRPRNTPGHALQCALLSKGYPNYDLKHLFWRDKMDQLVF